MFAVIAASEPRGCDACVAPSHAGRNASEPKALLGRPGLSIQQHRPARASAKAFENLSRAEAAGRIEMLERKWLMYIYYRMFEQVLKVWSDGARSFLEESGIGTRYRRRVPIRLFQTRSLTVRQAYSRELAYAADPM